MELRKVDSGNIWKIIKLAVNDDQQGFVATNTQSILEAYTTITSGGVALPFGLYEGDTPVGFVMFGYGNSGEETEPSVAKGNYCIWRFMIDKAYQGRGHGKQAMAECLTYLRTAPCGEAEYCWLSYEPENVGAKALYTSFGFRESGEVCGGEIVSVVKL
ncbi:MAG: GNAT family N-acetyltransferase [Oscillospiraceae bacterium]